MRFAPYSPAWSTRMMRSMTGLLMPSRLTRVLQSLRETPPAGKGHLPRRPAGETKVTRALPPPSPRPRRAAAPRGAGRPEAAPRRPRGGGARPAAVRGPRPSFRAAPRQAGGGPAREPPRAPTRPAAEGPARPQRAPHGRSHGGGRLHPAEPVASRRPDVIAAGGLPPPSLAVTVPIGSPAPPHWRAELSVRAGVPRLPRERGRGDLRSLGGGAAGEGAAPAGAPPRGGAKRPLTARRC